MFDVTSNERLLNFVYVHSWQTPYPVWSLRLSNLSCNAMRYVFANSSSFQCSGISMCTARQFLSQNFPSLWPLVHRSLAEFFSWSHEGTCAASAISTTCRNAKVTPLLICWRMTFHPQQNPHRGEVCRTGYRKSSQQNANDKSSANKRPKGGQDRRRKSRLSWYWRSRERGWCVGEVFSELWGISPRIPRTE